MNNYYRITAYHKEKNISAIFDSNGYFEKLWQFSAYLVQKGFNIIEVNKEDNFEDVNFEKVEYDNKHIFLRACSKGQPTINDKIINVNGSIYIKA